VCDSKFCQREQHGGGRPTTAQHHRPFWYTMTGQCAHRRSDAVHIGVVTVQKSLLEPEGVHRARATGNIRKPIGA